MAVRSGRHEQDYVHRVAADVLREIVIGEYRRDYRRLAVVDLPFVYRFAAGAEPEAERRREQQRRQPERSAPSGRPRVLFFVSSFQSITSENENYFHFVILSPLSAFVKRKRGEITRRYCIFRKKVLQ